MIDNNTVHLPQTEEDIRMLTKLDRIAEITKEKPKEKYGELMLHCKLGETGI